MSVYKPKGTEHFWYDFQFHGQRFRGSTGEASRREAEQAERRIRDEVKKAALLADKASGPVSQRDMPFGVAAERYYQEQGQFTVSADETNDNIARLVEWIGEGRLLSTIDDELVASLVIRRRKDYRWGKKKYGHVSPRQVNYTVTLLLKRILLRARDMWRIPLPNIPIWKNHLLDEKSGARELRLAEEEALEKVERDDYRPARLFAQATGLRRREVCNLTWAQIHWEEGYIEVIGKGDKRHRVPLTREVQAILQTERGRHPTNVFTYLCQRTTINPRSKTKHIKGQRYPITYWGWGTAFRRSVGKAGLVGISIHKLRHTAGSRTARAAGLSAASRLLNHSSYEVTRKFYEDTNLEDLREAMEIRAKDESARRKKHVESTKSPKKSPKTRA